MSLNLNVITLYVNHFILLICILYIFFVTKHKAFNHILLQRNMGTLDNVLQIRKALETLLKTPEDISSDASVHIQELDAMKMNLKLLQKSKIGFTLDKLRKATDDDIIKKSAKSLIKKWQKLDVPAEKSKESSKNSSDEENKSPSDRLIPIDFGLTAPVPTKTRRANWCLRTTLSSHRISHQKKCSAWAVSVAHTLDRSTQVSQSRNTGRRCGRSCPQTGSRAWTSGPGCPAACMTRPGTSTRSSAAPAWRSGKTQDG